ncbi:hypothetical protein ACFLZY_02080 [Patescibacteria group bacterium]
MDKRAEKNTTDLPDPTKPETLRKTHFSLGMIDQKGKPFRIAIMTGENQYQQFFFTTIRSTKRDIDEYQTLTERLNELLSTFLDSHPDIGGFNVRQDIRTFLKEMDIEFDRGNNIFSYLP